MPKGNRRKKRRSVGRRVVTGLLVLGTFGAFLGAISLIGMLWFYGRDLPTVRELTEYRPPQTTRIVDRHGVLIGEIFSERRTVVPMDRIPRILVLAVLAAEDADFYQHEGLDYPGILRAVVRDVFAGRPAQGASTITQQVVKTHLLTPERTIERKVKELILARRLEQELTKDQILYLYLNHINFGHGRYGVQEASQFYFGKDVNALGISEATLLAGLPQAPTRLSPRTHPEAAKRRQAYILGQLEKKREDYWPDLRLDDIEKARTEEVTIVPRKSPEDAGPEILVAARSLLSETLDPEDLERGGFTVHSTIDLALQAEARAALRKGLDDLASRHKYPGPTDLAKAEGSATKDLESPQGAVVVIDPRTRDLLALVGGFDDNVGFNRATQARRQPGSTFKPIVMALGMKSRALTPATVILDAPAVYDQWKPSNYETWNYEGAIRLREGLARSINSVAVRAIDEVGPDKVVTFAEELGISTPLDPSLALALGASEVVPLELANAFATFAAGGRWVPARLFTKIERSDGSLVPLPKDQTARDVLSPAESYLITSLLQSVVSGGTGRKAQALERPVAGKTGTSNDARDAWFVGYTAHTVATVWVGFDRPRPLGRKESGGRVALPIWVDVMKRAEKGKAAVDFAMPSGVVTARIDPATGRLAYPDQPDAVEEVFLEGTVPTEVATPPEAVDSKTFLLEELTRGAGEPSP
ncbi:MAG: PBP1A family penicillin-binding protein [Myxococcales bacterium]|nr:PBP1A family penicillin-binding protein [Myxococcales bacterium]